MSKPTETVPTLGEICHDVAAGSSVLAQRMLPVAGKAARAFVAFLGGAPVNAAGAKTKAKKDTGAHAEGKDEPAGKPGLRARLRARTAPAAKDSEKPAADTTTKDPGPAKDSKSPKPDATAPASGEGPAKTQAGKEKPDEEEPSGGLLERAGVGLFTCAIGWAFLRPVLSAVGRALAQVAVPFALIGMVLWVIAAYRAAPRNDQEKDAGGEQPAQTAGPAPGPGLADVAAAETWLRHLVIQRVQEAVADGRRGIHLSALLEEPGIPDTWTVTTVREHCERLAIPVKSIRIRGSKHKGPTHGVHTDELTTALGMSLAQALQHLDEVAAHTPPDDPGQSSFGDVLDASSDPALTVPDETLPAASPATGEEASPTSSPGEPHTPPRRPRHHLRWGRTRTRPAPPSGTPVRPSPDPHS
ncbi:hypothetical protein ACFRDV_22140 [Streptomyces fagopyri]|uniref:hypothetical protein n=1 Tax=Streptomyces fagopyri TaxID=2662397 RepID=UPI00368B8E8A